MKKVFKYPLEVIDEQTVPMSAGAELLSVQMQNGQVCLWALVDINEDAMCLRRVFIHGTGHEIHHDGKYVATFQARDGALVFHVFDGGEA